MASQTEGLGRLHQKTDIVGREKARRSQSLVAASRAGRLI